MASQSDEEFKRLLKKLDEDKNKLLKTYMDSWMESFFLNNNKEEPTGIRGISGIKQSLDNIRKMNLITSCICCRNWKIDKEKTYLLGTCELSSKQISYDRTCENWSKIGDK